MNITDFLKFKIEKRRMSMITCYDYTFARLINRSPIDMILVGDSCAMVMHGNPTTIPATLEMMSLHTQAVSRGAPEKWIVADLPFPYHRLGQVDAMRAVDVLMKAGAHSVKIEGVSGHEEVICHVVESGVPVMGHLGLTPQSVHQLGGFRVQGREAAAADLIFQQAQKLQELGCYALVLECVPSVLAAKITAELTIPTIGIGAGVETDGQVLVLQDLLGLQEGFRPKFLRTFAEGASLVSEAFQKYDSAVKNGTFPSIEESYS